MPNWCTNTLHITGPEEDVRAFVLKAKGVTPSYNDSHTASEWEVFDEIRKKALYSAPPDDYGEEQVFCFHGLHPVPVDFRRFPYDDTSARKVGEAIGEPRTYGGYGWQSAHWGTKWDACEASLDYQEPTALGYSFDTAWGPPIALFDKVSNDFPTLTFTLRYHEGGMGFAGDTVWSDGELESDDSYDIEWDEKEGEWNRV
jgi:hypothetical protein